MIFGKFNKDFKGIFYLAEYLIHLSNEFKERRGLRGRKRVVLAFNIGIIEVLF